MGRGRATEVKRYGIPEAEVEDQNGSGRSDVIWAVGYQ